MNSKSNNSKKRFAAFGARFAVPQTLFLSPEGVHSAEGQVLPFADWCAAHPGAAVELIVSARLLHELLIEPGLPLDGEAALAGYAQQQFSHYFGAVAQRWAVAPWRAAGGQRGASALHGLDWPALQQAAAEAGVDLRSARPAWAPLLQRVAREEGAGPQTAALAWVEGTLLSWILLQAGEVREVRQLRLAEPTLDALNDTLAELRATSIVVAGYGLSGTALMPAGVRALGFLNSSGPDLGAFEAAPPRGRGLPQPDFLGQRVRRSLLAWPLALTGLLVLATAGWSAWDSRQQRDAAQDQVARLQSRANGQRAALAPRPVARSNNPADAERLRSAAEVQALLQQGWEPLLANVEQAGVQLPQLNWLALDYSAGRNELRLEGLVQDKAVALQLVDRLAAAPGWGQVVLSRFQTGEQGLAGQRFEVGARLQTTRMQADLPVANNNSKKTP
ncbi:hypothetical protein [Pelomonas sp. KK5]|uniref:hypothetical protein n=1 Tax=Pelomonas sp. KK5 TaxID=1855730 RepID=UPI00097C5B6E|nr:hypothetical protein [Pelomonas sp. KK5]